MICDFRISLSIEKVNLKFLIDLDMDNNGKEHLTSLLECESIITSADLSPLFNHPRQGFVRLVNDHFKRSFMLEIFQSIKLKKKPDDTEPCFSIEVDYLFFNIG